uniref:Uncharacterized protein n=1 Tax=Cacopsylla melanoneura TaxID=428564 RepID=A0A8D9BEE9_9HEMI
MSWSWNQHLPRFLYISEKNWTSCAIFCRKKQTGEYFAPRVDMRGSKYSGDEDNLYFPDGTWCHNDAKYQYYCVNHECTEEVRISYQYLSNYHLYISTIVLIMSVLKR